MADSAPTDGPELVEQAMRIIAGKWKPAIIYHLERNESLRFNELRRRIPDISQRMLTLQLRDLELHGLVSRVHHPEIPPRVEYSLTKLGATLEPIWIAVCHWCQEHMAEVHSHRERHCTDA